MSNHTVKSLTLVTVIATVALVRTQCCLGNVQTISDVLGFDFDVESLCSCLRIIVCVVWSRTDIFLRAQKT